MAGNYDFLTYVGEDFDYILTWYDSDGALVNLTGYTAHLQVGQALVISTVPDSSGLITLGGQLGTIHLQINEAAIAALGKTSVQYRLFIVDLRPETSALLVGNFVTA